MAVIAGRDTKTVDVTTHYLEMQSLSEFRPKPATLADYQVVQVGEPSPEFNRYLYCAVGWKWYWTDKLSWTYDDWRDYVQDPNLETWVAYVAGTPAGYFELAREPDDNSKIVYFGLLPEFTGRGIGGPLLSSAIDRGWQVGAKRVWVHTCTLDHPAALPNYLARGFREYRQETHKKIISLEPRRSWP